MTYTIRKVGDSSVLDLNWENPAWWTAETLEVKNFRPESSAHRPRTRARLLHDARGIHGIFQVQDRYVRNVATEYFGEVWKDACVEFFAQPKPDAGYLNFEFNGGGAFLCCYITDSTRAPDGFKKFVRLPPEIGKQIHVRSSLPRVVEPEITEPMTWTLQFFITFSVLEKYAGPLGEVSGQTWRGNFFKCAETNSHPHWAAWSPVDELNFHLPRCFGQIRFE